MPTSPALRPSTGKRMPIPQNRIRTSDSEELLEEVRQLRAALAVYRQLVNRLLTEHAPSRTGNRERNRLASRVNVESSN
jgi:hypothetical protein